MARYQIILAYDGTDFVGSQRQADSRTVQGELEKALRAIGWDGSSILLAGRTDSGTHASGQVAAFDLDWGHGLDDLHKALNSNLPPDLAVKEARMAAEKFHPRFDAASRRYCYRLFCASARDPLRERYAWRVWPPVSDLAPLASLWLGAHDFAAFGTPPRPAGSTMRTVLSAGWQARGDEWIFNIQADAFLYHMVRRLVSVQVAVGQGRLPAEVLAEALANSAQGLPPGLAVGAQPSGGGRGIPAGLAPPNGLTLVEVCYANLV